MNKIPLLLEIAQAEIGVRETGPNDGPRVRAYQDATDSVGAVPWCGCFLVWCFRRAGIDLPRPWDLAAAKAWFPRRGADPRPVRYVSEAQARPGDVVGIPFHGGVIRHVGLVVEVRGDKILTVEGNTNDNGSREGNGVYLKERHRAGLVYARWNA